MTALSGGHKNFYCMKNWFRLDSSAQFKINMETVNLEAKTRDFKISAKALRQVNLLPAEYYGRGVKNKSVQMDYQAFRKAYVTAGSNMIITLDVDGKEKVNVLVHEVKYDPLTDLIAHVDFINVNMNEAINARIPVVFIGVAPAVKELAGILAPHLDEVEVRCLPKDLIHKIEVSINGLVDFHSYVRVKDLNLPPTITVLNDPSDVVVTVVAPRKEEDEMVQGSVVAAGDVPVVGAEGVSPETAPAEGGVSGEVKGK